MSSLSSLTALRILQELVERLQQPDSMLSADANESDSRQVMSPSYSNKKEDFVRDMLRKFDVADSDGDGVVTFAGKESKAKVLLGNDDCVQRTQRGLEHVT